MFIYCRKYNFTVFNLLFAALLCGESFESGDLDEVGLTGETLRKILRDSDDKW